MRNKKNADYVQKIAVWMKNCVDEVIANLNDNCSTYVFPLDDKLQIAIGWSDGFVADSERYIQDPAELVKGGRTFYALSAKVCERGVDAYEWLLMPFNTPLAAKKDSRCVEGEVYDTDNSISPNEDYGRLAKSLYQSYLDIRKGIDKGLLTFSND